MATALFPSLITASAPDKNVTREDLSRATYSKQLAKDSEQLRGESKILRERSREIRTTSQGLRRKG